MRRYLDVENERAHPKQQNPTELEKTASDPEIDGGPTAAAERNDDSDAHQDLIDAGESPECPDCGSMSLYYSEGCKTCESCGWSEC
jgi:ribonucleoside-diphosphate reductase alpha chain